MEGSRESLRTPHVVPLGVELVDVDSLADWLDAEGLEAGLPLVVEPLTGGSSNAMFVVERGDARWVLRRPTRVAVDRANEGMRREFRILAALAGTDVPHPEVVALCDDHSVLGCTFYLMERVRGVNPFPLPAMFDTDERRSEVAYSMVEALARLHLVDWRAAGIGDLGRPEGFHQRQVDRWSRQLASYEGRDLPGLETVMAWLGSHLPDDGAATIMHGDYHMLNVLIAPEPPGRVVAILDWETATIGDPLLDLAGFCEVWTPVASGVGWPSRSELIERYRAVRGLGALGDLTYYEVLYNFRLAVLVEGIFQRSLRDPTRPDQVDMGERVLLNVDRALTLIKGGGSS
jgi:aminoglycoside phosphotransferase (APT) family kinase protein